MTEPRRTTQVAERTASQAGLPLDIEAEAEREHALVPKAELTAEQIMKQANRAVMLFEQRSRLLKTLDAATLIHTDASMWVKFRAKDGSEKAMLSAEGCRLLMGLHGIKIFNLRDTKGNPTSVAEWIEEEDGSYTAVIIGDCESTFTIRQADGSYSEPIVLRSIEGVIGARNSKEDFVGRGAFAANKAIAKYDQLKAARTALDNSCVHIVTATARRDVQSLKAAGLDPERMVKGAGYGSGKERATEEAANPAEVEAMKSLRVDMIGWCGGDEAEAEKHMKKFVGFDKTEDGKKVRVEPRSWIHLTTWKDGVAKCRKAFEAQVAKEQGA